MYLTLSDNRSQKQPKAASSIILWYYWRISRQRLWKTAKTIT